MYVFWVCFGGLYSMEFNLMSQNAVPKLRFPGFSGEWEVKKLEDVAPLQRGFDLPNSEQRRGNYPVVFSNGPLKRHNEYKAKAPGVVTGRSGTIGKVHYIEENYWPHNTSLWVTDFNGNNPKYIYYLYSNIGLERFGGGSGVPTLNRNDVHSQKLAIPTKPEQEKVAGFLTVVDKRISLIDKKVCLLQQYKKGIMQKIFTQQIRFKDEKGQNYPDWQEKRLGDVFDERTETGDDRDRMLSVTINNGIVPFSSINRKDNSNVGKGNYKRVKQGDIAYNSMRMWQGASGVSQYGGIVSPAYTVITVNDKNDSVFWSYYFKLTSMIHVFERHSQGLTPDTWNLKFKSLSKIKSRSPHIEEQQKIADFLTSLDDKINLEKAKLEQAKQFKKSLLQRMFV